MYIYNYTHIWRAARNVKNPPANNYGKQGAPALLRRPSFYVIVTTGLGAIQIGSVAS